MTHPRMAAIVSALLLTVSAVPAPAQRISPADRDSAIDAIAAAIRQSYVFPDERAGIIQRLERARSDGRYRTDDPALLAQRVTDDLQAASDDGHLYLQYDPAQYAAASRATTAGAQGEDLEAYWRRLAIRDHHGLTEMRVLPGNIRYLRISGFHWVRDETGAAYDGAMRFMREGDAIIIDLRGNGGGSHAAVKYLVSHFLGADTLEMTFLQGTETPVQSRTLEHLPAGRLTGKPLYVLIDGGAGSAAEAFAYDVQQFKLGELVGARTAGAANNNKLVPIAPYFMLSVSYGRPVHPVSGTNWERSGIEPSVPAAAAQAMEVAETLALSRLAWSPGASPEARAEYAWARVEVEARHHPVAIASVRLKALAGRYGELEVAFRDRALWLERENRPPRRLSPLTSEGLFAVEGSTTLRVRFTPKGLEMLRRGDPNPSSFGRE
jgi:hypothetical protein